MKKQELIEKINVIPWDEGLIVDTLKINRAGLLQLIEQLDEPQKPTIPQVVADWIETCKENNIISLSGAFEYAKGEVEIWLSSWENQEIFALAWINGYEVEKEKRYRVRLKGIAERYCYLNYSFLSEGWFFDDEHTNTNTRAKHTRKELEESGFGWVFDCPGIEIEEVEE